MGSRGFHFSCMLFAFLILPFFLQGCAEKERFKQTATLDQFENIQSEQKLQQESKKAVIPMLPAVGATSTAGDDYLLGAGDLLSITIFESEELNRDVRVSALGNINAALIGDVNVMNLTVAEAEKKIADLYQKDYLHEPHVSVYIKEHMSKMVTLTGEVEKPGTYTYVSRRKLLDVLAMGNGLSDQAGSIAYITREDPKTRETKNYYVDLDDLVKNGNMAQNHVIMGGDVIFIPESGQYFVDGAVRNPGSYPISNNMTVTEAITTAGGLAGYADIDNIKLVRYMGRGKEREVVTLKQSDLQAGVGDTLVLLDQDIIYAESSGSGKFFSGSGFTLGFMGTGVSYKDPTK